MTTDKGRPSQKAEGSRRIEGLAGKVVAVALWLVLWQLASMLIDSQLLLAGPLDTLVRLVQLLGDAVFLSAVRFSLARIVGGFLLAYASGVALAMLAHRWPRVGELIAPAVLALKSVPVACVVVLLLIWVGSRRVSGIVVFLAVFPAVYYSCAEGLRNVDEGVSQMLSVFRVRRVVRLLAHVWPQVLPYLVGTSKNVCGMAWKAGIAAELIGSPRGSIGERIYQAKILLETADLFAWTIVVVVASALCERIFVWLLSQSDRQAQRLALVLARSGTPLAVEVPQRISFAHATIGYPGTTVCSDLSLSLAPGERVVLVDASGTGKSTLLHTMMGLQPLLEGTASLPGSVTAVFQTPRLVEAMTPFENVLLALGASADDETIDEALRELLPPGALDVPVSELSGGQRRRVEIVRAMVCSGEAVLLDEPFASLDEQTHRQAAAFVDRWLDARTLVVASHVAGDAELLGARALHLFES